MQKHLGTYEVRSLIASKLSDFSSAADETSESIQERVRCHAVKGF